MKMVHRWQHTDEQWNRMIADELATGRPIYISRSTKYDGHAFVVCGMDEQELYYVNWRGGRQLRWLLRFRCGDCCCI